jgi:hypothetical protein
MLLNRSETLYLRDVHILPWNTTIDWVKYMFDGISFPVTLNKALLLD